jgi:hypothetical protein
MKKVLGILVLGLFTRIFVLIALIFPTYALSEEILPRDEELFGFVSNILEVLTGDIDPKIEVEFEGDSDHRYVNFKILDQVLH